MYSSVAPDGYVLAPGPPGDLSELLAIVGAVQMKYEGTISASEGFWKTQIEDPEIDPARDFVQIRSASTGELAGLGRYVNHPPHVESSTRGFVHPDHEGRGIGTFIVNWGLELSQSRVGEAPSDARVTNVADANVNNRSAQDLFHHNGYTIARYFLEMERVLDGPVTVEDLPENLSLRTMSGPEDIEVIVDPISEAFRDHYGHTDSTRDSEIEMWTRFRAMDDWDDSLVWIVEAAGVPIAVNVSISHLGAREDTGYVGSLSVLREWRGMGIARALLTIAFAEFQRRGRRSVVLHVDADSLTGAKRLYESVGMRETQREVSFSREIRPGIDVVVR